jgi:hypothetical protein
MNNLVEGFVATITASRLKHRNMPGAGSVEAHVLDVREDLQRHIDKGATAAEIAKITSIADKEIAHVRRYGLALKVPA